MQVARFREQATMSHWYEKNPAVKYKLLVNLDLHPPWVVKSSQLPAKIAAYSAGLFRGWQVTGDGWRVTGSGWRVAGDG